MVSDMVVCYYVDLTNLIKLTPVLMNKRAVSQSTDSVTFFSHGSSLFLAACPHKNVWEVFAVLPLKWDVGANYLYVWQSKLARDLGTIEESRNSWL